MQDLNTASSKILLITSYELKLLLRGFLLPACLGAFLAYIIIFFIDVERSGAFNTIPMSVVPIVGTIIVLKFLVYTRLEKTEIHRFRFIFLTLICLSIGGLIYIYYQFFAGIPAPFPSIADFICRQRCFFHFIYLVSFV